jgi:ribosomal protein L37E
MERIFKEIEHKKCKKCGEEHAIPQDKDLCLSCRMEESKKNPSHFGERGKVANFIFER